MDSKRLDSADHLLAHFRDDTELCRNAVTALTRSFQRKEDFDLIVRELASPMCRFSWLPGLFSAMRALSTIEALCIAKPRLLQALLMVASRSTNMNCPSDVWDLLRLGLAKAEDLDLLTLCFRAALVKFDSMPEDVRKLLGSAVMRYGRTLAQHGMDSAQAVFKFLKRVGAGAMRLHLYFHAEVLYAKSSSSAGGSSFGKMVADIVCLSLKSYLGSAPPGFFVNDMVDLCVSGCPVHWLSVLEGIVLKDQWRELCKPPVANLCSLLDSAMPMVFLEGHRTLKLLSKEMEPVHAQVVDAWACLLQATPLDVTHAWTRGCCGNYICWLGEAVLLRLITLVEDGTRSCENHVEYMEKVYASFKYRSQRFNLSGGVDDIGACVMWVDLAVRAVTKTWALYSTKYPAYVSAAMNLLGAAVYMSKDNDMFVREPHVVDFVLQAFRTMAPCPGSLLCARNGLVSLAHTPAMLPGFQAAVKTFVTRVADDGFALLRSPRSYLVDLVWALRLLQYGTPASVDEDMASGLFALRVLHSVLQRVTVGMRERDVLEAVSEVMIKLPATFDVCNASLVLRIVVCMYSSNIFALQSGSEDAYWLSDITNDSCTLLKHFLGNCKVEGFKEACVHPWDHEWNCRLFCLLASRYNHGNWKEWIDLLIPSISFDCIVVKRVICPTLQALVDLQLVRVCIRDARMYVWMYRWIELHGFFCVFFFKKKPSTGQGVPELLRTSFGIYGCSGEINNQKLFFIFLFRRKKKKTYTHHTIP